MKMKLYSGHCIVYSAQCAVIFHVIVVEDILVWQVTPNCTTINQETKNPHISITRLAEVEQKDMPACRPDITRYHADIVYNILQILCLSMFLTNSAVDTNFYILDAIKKISQQIPS